MLLESREQMTIERAQLQLQSSRVLISVGPEMPMLSRSTEYLGLTRLKWPDRQPGGFGLAHEAWPIKVTPSGPHGSPYGLG